MDQALRCISAGATFVLHTTPTARREEERRHEDQNKLSGFRCPCTDPHLPHHQTVPESGDGIPKISLCSTRSRDLKLQRLSEGHREFKVLSGSVTLYCCFQNVLQIWPWFVRAIGLDWSCPIQSLFYFGLGPLPDSQSGTKAGRVEQRTAGFSHDNSR